jgi:N-acyl-D-aspartate/D-glutamate deacylase
VRDRQSLTLPEAIRKMSLMPAQRLEALTSEAKRLGRLQAGARADIVVFDAGTIADRATFRAPTEPSTGVRYLVVDGTVVVDDGELIDTVFPGKPLLGAR